MTTYCQSIPPGYKVAAVGGYDTIPTAAISALAVMIVCEWDDVESNTCVSHMAGTGEIEFCNTWQTIH